MCMALCSHTCMTHVCGSHTLVCSFDSSSAHTVGFEFRGRKLPITPSLTVNAQIWDTAGQERFQALTEQYLRGAVGIFIVYDVTSRKSFENLGSWLKKIDDTAHPNAVRSLIGNKSDMPAKREVTALQGLKLAQHHHMDFCEVSAASGLNVEVAMRRLIVTVSNSLIEQDERLSLPNLNIEELGLGIDMPSLDTPPRKQVKHVLQTKLPSGWVAETGSGTGGGYVNTWTGEIVTDRPTVTAGQGKIDYDRPKEDLEQIDISFADIKMMKKKKFSKKQLAADDGGKISFGLHGMLAKEADEGCAPNGCVLM